MSKTTPKPTGGETIAIDIPQMKIATIVIRLIGDAPLVVHAWSDKAKKMMLDKQMKKGATAKEAKDPWRDYVDSLYWISKKPARVTEDSIKAAKFGFPAVGFKRAAVDACSHVSNITKVLARGAFHIEGDVIEIKGTPNMREDMVRIAMGTADIRYRGEFKTWSVALTIRYNTGTLSAEQIVNLFNTAGFAIGVGENRPQKNGSWGLFHVAREAA